MGYQAAGVVDEIGADVSGVELKPSVRRLTLWSRPGGPGRAVLWAPIPNSLDYATSAAIPVAAEAAARSLDQLGLTEGNTVLINGASGSVGSVAVQLAVARGARVIGTGRPSASDTLRSLGAEPVAYGDGMPERVRDCAGGCRLRARRCWQRRARRTRGARWRALARDHGDGLPRAQQTGVRFSRGDTGRATYALTQVARMAEAGQFSIQVGQTFPLSEVAEAHRVSEAGTVRGKLCCSWVDRSRSRGLEDQGSSRQS